MKSIFPTLVTAATIRSFADARSTNDQLTSDLNLGSFQNPSARARPRFRYWIPDASVNLSTLKSDIADAGKVGAGGVELLGYYSYGDIEPYAGAIPTDWTDYGWGTPKWRKYLSATKDNNLIIDLALGPNQGAGVPAALNSDGLQWDLQPFNMTVEIGGRFSGVLPGWNTGPLVAASTGLVTKTTNVSSEITYTLSATSLQDVTSKVSSRGELTVDFPSNVTGEHFMIFSYYLVHTQYREQQTPLLVTSGNGVQQSPVVSFVQNGSWVVDHFSATGAKIVADFWNEYLLSGGETADLVREVGNYIWEDSQEFPSNIIWTPKVPEAFHIQHGYELAKYLPIFMNGNAGGISVLPVAAPPVFVTDEPLQDAKHVADFRQTMTELNKGYLDGLTKFAHSIGVQSSTQVAYNFPLDMLSNIPHVDAPETETLGFSHNIDAYRQFVGPAGLAGKRVISSEAGAVTFGVFQQTIPELLWDLNRSIVGGINAFVLHGMPFSGYYPNTTWPTYTTFLYMFSEMHNRHQPGWDYYRDFMDYTARVQQVTQTGVAKVDIAFWSKKTSYVTVPTIYAPNDLVQAGYTYEYLSPDDFSLPSAFVQNGVLAPKAQAFKALVLRGNDTLTVSGVANLCHWTKQGLPIVISGGFPSNVSGTISSEDLKAIRSDLNALKTMPNVHLVPFDGLAESLAKIGIRPRTSTTSDSSDGSIWYSRWRESANETAVFIYNDATGIESGMTPSEMNLTFEATGRPYVYDAWTGEQTPLTNYTHDGKSTTISMTLAGNQTKIIAFRQHGVYADAATSDSWKTHAPSRTIILNNWTLTIESWTAPPNFDIEGTVKRNTTYAIGALLPWRELKVANLTYTSGRGYYHTSFDWSPSSSNVRGAIITMDAIIHTAVLYVNGQRTVPLDITWPRVDVTKHLKQGLNSIDIVVSTPLGNSVIPVQDQLRSMGAVASNLVAEYVNGPGSTLISVKDYGLVGEVSLMVY
ncbi:hypothetical protein AC578_6891 [Pseudocercospora eumusae]|uniref:Glycosyl hydrolases family 2 sugar binding domain-containing protein n=1 Tax=Pseudocercospora eumusae TaxID=321146 RepID=A0A139H9U9_9PEZI|nr:hypothetical protein AC578_6891 [Pseudocercospora eumusae]